jgi:DNA-binding CsgD family transcriptional regulator
VLRRAGRLREAEADARVALEAALDPAVAFARGVGPLAGTLLDRGRVDDAAREFTAVVPEDIPDSPPMTPVLLARMALRAARREHALALADWEEALRRTPRGPTPAWIVDLAVAAGVHQALGDGDATQALVDQADALAQTWDTPTARAEVLLARARLTEVDAAVDLLRVAVAELEGTPTRLIEARAQVDLGGALRRRGHRVESREPLRAGYELARACGADGLAETARAELRASGIRLRREAASGADALTPSERRIAELAAAGMSNAEVAQELFLTVKTVEMHLTHTYRKLDIRGRSELAQALGSKP